MGNDTKQSIYNGNFKEKEWRAISVPRSQVPGNPITVRTTDNKISADQYIIEAKAQSNFERERIIYQQRASSMTGSLVNIFSVEQIDSEKQFPSGFKNALRVRTEKIPWRLHQSSNLEIHEGLYILDGAFQGFYELVQHVRQGFQVTNEMIGLNAFGRVKVWVNGNFAINEVQQWKNKNTGLKIMLEQIILQVEFHLKGQSFPENIRNSLFRVADFFSAMNVVSSILNTPKEQKVQIGKKLVNTIVLNQALKQYAEEKTERNLSNVPQKRPQSTNPQNNKMYSVVEFERKAIQFQQKDGNQSNKFRRSGFQEVLSDKPGDSSLYHSPIDNFALGNNNKDKMSVKSNPGFYGNTNQPTFHASTFNNHTRNPSNLENSAHNGSSLNQLQLKKSAIISHQKSAKTRDPIAKSDIFSVQSSEKDRRRLVAPNQIRSLGKYSENFSNQGNLRHSNITPQSRNKPSGDIPSALSEYQRRPIFTDKNTRAPEGRSRSQTPTVSNKRISDLSLSRRVPFGQTYNKNQSREKEAESQKLDVKKAGQIRKNSNTEAFRQTIPFGNIHHREQHYASDANFHAQNNRIPAFLQNQNTQGLKHFGSGTPKASLRKNQQLFLAHSQLSKSQKHTDSIPDPSQGSRTSANYQIYDSSFNLAGKPGNSSEDIQKQKVWGTPQQLRKSQITINKQQMKKSSLHKKPSENLQVNQSSSQPDSIVLSRVGNNNSHQEETGKIREEKRFVQVTSQNSASKNYKNIRFNAINDPNMKNELNENQTKATFLKQTFKNN